MIDLFLEGVSSALLPCTLVIALPAFAVMLAARQESTPGLTGYVVTLLGYSWLRFSERTAEIGAITIAGLLAIGTVTILIPVIRRLDVVSAAGGFLIGVAAAALWQPCVGAEFGGLLDDLPTSGATGFGLFAVHLIGVMGPILAIGVVLHLVPDGAIIPIRPVMMVLGGGTLAILTLAVAGGFHEEVIFRLYQQSL